MFAQINNNPSEKDKKGFKEYQARNESWIWRLIRKLLSL
jgi:hypothetical protein